MKLTVFLLFTCLTLAPSLSFAMPEYAEKTRQGCKTCHETEEGGELSDTGLEYSASGYTWPPERGYRAFSPIGKGARTIIGFIHIAMGFMWFGAILYVHIVLRPAYAAKGLPKTEVAIGMVSMLFVGVTGLLLVLSKIKGPEVLLASQWGRVLLFKIALYLTMITMAAIVVLFIGPKLRSSKRTAVVPKDGVFDPLTLAGFDGKDGRPAYIACKGKIYDVSASIRWRSGTHFRHSAGEDLTKAIGGAPHGEEKLEDFRQIGEFDQTRKPPKTSAQKLFYVIAYTNLALVFVVLLTIAYWRWGI